MTPTDVYLIEKFEFARRLDIRMREGIPLQKLDVSIKGVIDMVDALKIEFAIDGEIDERLWALAILYFVIFAERASTSIVVGHVGSDQCERIVTRLSRRVRGIVVSMPDEAREGFDVGKSIDHLLPFKNIRVVDGHRSIYDKIVPAVVSLLPTSST